MGSFFSRLLLTAGVLLSFSSFATVLKQVELVPHGALSGRADLFNISVLFLPGEGDLDLEIRPLRISGEQDEKVTQIPWASDKRVVGENFVIVRAQIKASLQDPKSGFALTSVAVPYSLFESKDSAWSGGYKLGYQITGKHNGAVVVTDFVAPTQLNWFQPRLFNAGEAFPSAPHAAETTTKKVWGYVLKYDQNANTIKKEAVAVDVAVPAPNREEGRIANAPQIDAFNRPNSTPKNPAALSLAGDLKTKYRIWYGTNRKRVSDATDESRFSTDLSPQVTYGSSYVNIPVKVHNRGDIELGSWWKSTSEADTFNLYALSSIEKNDFNLATNTGDILIFIHGYNTGFKTDLLVAAQIAYDMAFPGKVIAFSWPSQGSMSPWAYLSDAKMAAATVPYLTDFLKNIIKSEKITGDSRRKIHIIAHSMGNEILLPALRSIELSEPGLIAKRFQNMVLTAPDVGEGKFATLLPTVIRSSEKTSFYYSTQDWALGVSDTINGESRAGLFPVFFTGMDTINTDDVNSFIGHNYYSTSVPVLSDLFLLVNRNLAPNFRRPPLAKPEELVGYQGFPHYRFLRVP